MLEKKMIVVCEGQTEKIYLARWAALCNVRHKVEILCSACTSPMSLLEEGVKEYFWGNASGEEKYSGVWVVFDRDGHECFHRTLNEARKYPFVHLCWTNPCIEAWFLMHYKPLPHFARQKMILLESAETSIGDEHALVRREELWEKIIEPKDVLHALKAVWPTYGKTFTGICDTLKDKIDNAVAQCVGKSIRDDPQKIGSLMPEVLYAIARLGTKTDEEAELKVGPIWHAICCQRRAEAKLAEFTANAATAAESKAA